MLRENYFIFAKSRKAVTLVEILLACVLLAGAFLPIMGLMTSSIRATEQDENTQRAVMLCQEKLNMALQMPFNKFPVTKKTVYDKGSFTSNQVTLELGKRDFEGIAYTSTLTVEPYTVTFHVPTCDFDKKGNNIINKTNAGLTPTPGDWGWNDEVTHVITDKVKRYTVKVVWKDVGKTAVKEYVLSSLKADVREK